MLSVCVAGYIKGALVMACGWPSWRGGTPGATADGAQHAENGGAMDNRGAASRGSTVGRDQDDIGVPGSDAS